MKALGYIGSSTRPGGRDTETEQDFWDIEPRLRREALEGEVLFHLLRSQAEAITALMTLVHEHDPETERALPESSVERMQEDFRVAP